MSFPGLTGPVQLCDVVAEMAAVEAPRRRGHRRATYQPIVSGGYEAMRYSAGNKLEP